MSSAKGSYFNSGYFIQSQLNPTESGGEIIDKTSADTSIFFCAFWQYQRKNIKLRPATFVCSECTDIEELFACGLQS